ncbi:MAG: LPS-assembly protein LptD, partial [Elusimicrobia bacterium]|nr:LPS-assembly protein LptD [Elusimicrobiota bacterium]
MNRGFRYLALLGALFCTAPACAYDLQAPPGNDRVYFEADKADYDKGKDSIHLQGHALVLEYGVNPSSGPLKVTKGEDIMVFPSSHVFVSSGAVLMEDSGGALFGYDAVYDWGSQKGTIKNVNATYSPWRVLKAKSVRRKPGGTYVFKSGRITSCDYEDEHYSFSFTRMHFTPGDRLWGLNAIMYLGKIPVMYLPFIYRPLGNDAAYVTYLEPGYNKRNGLFMKTTIYHRYSKLITSRLFLDYYSKVGVGTGLELGWDNSKNFNGSVAGYRIRDGGVERWGLYGGY